MEAQEGQDVFSDIGGDFAKQVHKMLHDAPEQYDYTWNEMASHSLKRDLFHALWGGKDEYIPLFFPAGISKNDGAGDAYDLAAAQDAPEGAEYMPEARGKPCGHVFKKGEGVYRCRNCALDETCVFCSRCFHSSDHRGHDISFTINTGSGGCCDCGDPEAWRLPVNCAYHSPNGIPPTNAVSEQATSLTSIPLDLQASINATLNAAFHFILETLNASPMDMSRIPRMEQDVHMDEARTRGKTPRMSQSPVHLYSLVLWNDEKHSFQEVIDCLQDATGCTEEQGRQIADRVHNHGRHIVDTSPQLDRLIAIGKQINQIDLAITVRSARDIFREELAGLLITWIKDLAAARIGTNASFIRDAICEQLCQPFDPLTEEWDTNLLQMQVTSSGPDDRYYDIKRPLRIDQLLLNDLKLWKEARNDLRELYIFSMIVNPEFKKILGVRFAAMYPKLAKAFLVPDREPEHSVLLFSVQLLTVPTIALLLVEKYGFLTHIFQILHEFFTIPNSITHDSSVPTRINCDSPSFKNRRYFQVFHDLRYVIGTSAVQQAIPRNPLYLNQFLNLISLFEGMNPQVRYLGNHIEYETDVWVNAFNVTLQIAKACRQMAECYATHDTATLCGAITQVVTALSDYETKNLMAQNEEGTMTSRPLSSRFHPVELGTLPHVTSRCVRFELTTEPISFHHPLHWLLGQLLHHVGKLDAASLAALGYQNLTEVLTARNSANMDMISLILDTALRLQVLMAQIKGNIWVRNGYGIRGQAHHYSDNNFRENTLDTDLYLVQILAITHPYNTPVLTILDRFDMLSWLQPTPTHHSYDKSQALHMAEECLSLLIHVVNERAIPGQWPIEEEISREIIHGLCLGPRPYSELTKMMPERLSESMKFDQILSQVATFRAPDGVTETGMYRLKDEFFEHVDPYFFHYTRNQREEALEILRNRRRQAGNDDLVIVPKPYLIESGPFTELGNILHTPAMLHVIFYTLLGTVTGTSTDVMVEMACHLMMLAITDRNVFGVQEDVRVHGHTNYLFCYAAHTPLPRVRGNNSTSITLIELLHLVNSIEKLRKAHPELQYIINHVGQHGCPRARELVAAYAEHLSHATNAPLAEDDAAAKKKAADERRAKIMQQFAQAQQSFISNNEDILDDEDWDEMEGTENDVVATPGEEKWHYPSGTCIVCQEDTDGTSMYGMLAFIQASTLLRTTPFDDVDFVAEAAGTPSSLDRSVTEDHPRKADSTAEDFQFSMVDSGRPELEGQSHLSKGFPTEQHHNGLHATSCGHLMHIDCFESYFRGVELRQQNNILRNPPEISEGKEYLCPLCKSLNNVLLPIIWKASHEQYPGVLQEALPFNQWISNSVGVAMSKLEKSVTSFDTTDAAPYGASQRRQSDGAIKMRESISGFVSQVLTSPISTSFDALYRRYIRPSDEEMDDNDEFIFSPTRQLTPHEDAESIQRMYMRMYHVIHRAERLLEQDSAVRRLKNTLGRPDLLWNALGYTISCVEIAQRGVDSADESSGALGSTLLTGVSEMTGSLLRTMSETILTYTSMTVNADEREAANLRTCYLRRAKQIFGGHPTVRSPYAIQFEDTLLDEDLFMLLAETSMYLVPAMHLDPHHLMQLLYVAEIVKIVISLVDHVFPPDASGWASDGRIKALEASIELNPDAEASFQGFIRWTIGHIDRSDLDADKFMHAIKPRTIMALIRKFSLPFLRKSALLMFTRFAVKFPIVLSGSDLNVDEHTRLTQALNLPSLQEICSPPLTTDSAAYAGIVSGWCQALALKRRSHATIPLEINHPAIFELVGLPYRLDVLFELSNKRSCKNCKTTPPDPALCLICGELLCMQAFCCSEDGLGECYRHAQICGGDYGIFMRVKKCAVLFLHDSNGTFLPSPYLDLHGEVDINLRRGRPQYLHQKRYDDLRKTWLRHGVPSFVARRLDSVQDPGGWTTL